MHVRSAQCPRYEDAVCVRSIGVHRLVATDNETTVNQTQVIQHIQELGHKILPEGASLWLYGSRARGDARPDSDYDLLILLNKDVVDTVDYDRYMIPLSHLGLNVGEDVRAHIYTKDDWRKWKGAPFNENVEEDKVVLI